MPPTPTCMPPTISPPAIWCLASCSTWRTTNCPRIAASSRRRRSQRRRASTCACGGRRLTQRSRHIRSSRAVRQQQLPPPLPPPLPPLRPIAQPSPMPAVLRRQAHAPQAGGCELRATAAHADSKQAKDGARRPHRHRCLGGEGVRGHGGAHGSHQVDEPHPKAPLCLLHLGQGRGQRQSSCAQRGLDQARGSICRTGPEHAAQPLPCWQARPCMCRR
jgi:hypothetical protein